MIVDRRVLADAEFECRDAKPRLARSRMHATSAQRSAVNFITIASSTISAIARNKLRLCFWPNDSSPAQSPPGRASPPSPALPAFKLSHHGFDGAAACSYGSGRIALTR
jgi:hypothetical protein